MNASITPRETAIITLRALRAALAVDIDTLSDERLEELALLAKVYGRSAHGAALSITNEEE